MSEGISFSLPADLTFDEIKDAITRRFGTHAKYSSSHGDDSFCGMAIVAENKIHDITISRNGEPGSPFHNKIAVSVYEDPEAALDGFREVANKLGGVFYIFNDEGVEEVLPYVCPDPSSEEDKVDEELQAIIGRDATDILRYVAKDQEKYDRLMELMRTLSSAGV